MSCVICTIMFFTNQQHVLFLKDENPIPPAVVVAFLEEPCSQYCISAKLPASHSLACANLLQPLPMSKTQFEVKTNINPYTAA